MPEHVSLAHASDEAAPADVQPVSFEPPNEQDVREAAYQRHVAHTVNYNQAIRDAGDLPWFDCTRQLARLEDRFPGISKTPGEPARRRFFFARYGTDGAVA